MSGFLAHYENPSQSINVIINSEMQRVMETNQKVLESLTNIVLLCGTQGLALCGRDDKISWMEDNSAQYHPNEGNFVELVQFRAETSCPCSAPILQYPLQRTTFESL